MSKHKDVSSEEVAASRRNFFRLAFSEAIGIIEEFRGRPQMRLSELDQMPDHVIRQIIPMLNPHSPYDITKHCLLFKEKQRGNVQEVYRFTEQERFIIGYFNRKNTLESIGQLVSNTFGLSAEIAHQQVKAVFLMLAKRGIYIPAQAHNLNEEYKKPGYKK